MVHGGIEMAIGYHKYMIAMRKVHAHGLIMFLIPISLSPRVAL